VTQEPALASIGTTAGSALDFPPRTTSPAPLTLDDNRRAYRRLILSFVALTLVIALTRTLIMQTLADGPITWKTVAALGAAYAWPVLPVIAVINRWTRLRFISAMFGWFWLSVFLLSWRTTEVVTFPQILQWMLADITLPLVVVTALCLGGATRAVGPWLAPVFVVFSASSQLGLDHARSADRSQQPVRSLAGQLARRHRRIRQLCAAPLAVRLVAGPGAGPLVGAGLPATTDFRTVLPVHRRLDHRPDRPGTRRDGRSRLGRPHLLPALLWIPLGGKLMSAAPGRARPPLAGRQRCCAARLPAGRQCPEPVRPRH
jgi:hypothetical protein